MNIRPRRVATIVFPALALVVMTGCAELGSDAPPGPSDAAPSTSIGAAVTTSSVPKGSGDASGQGSTGSVPGDGGAGSAGQSGGTTLALTVLEGIRQENEMPTGYERELFRHWIDADGDRCNTREEVLISESRTPAQVDAYGCTVVEGDWWSPYDGRTHTDPSDLDIDHLVALKEAWDSGAHSWTPSQRERFANDISDGRALIAVTNSVNRSKSDRDPSNWLPSNTAHVCTYVSDWIAVKSAWGLSMDQSEWGRLKNLLNGQCSGTTIAPWKGVADPSRTTVPGSRPSTSTNPPSGWSPESPDGDQGEEALPTVRPGAFCTPQGALGTYSGRVYLCATTRTSGEPYSDGRARWRQR
jgi:hypothetical protein